ncbi:MAG: hypothetical protein ACKVU0_10895 [Saprospiraceae bacterium]
MATKSQGVRFDAFVENARPDPKSTEKLVLLQGYIGKSDLAGHIRVYSDPELSDFIELPEKDICYADPISTEEDPLGGSRLWVRQTTVFTAGDPNQSNRVKASFLEGDIVKAFGDTVNIPTVVLPIVAPTFAGPICHASRPKSCCETRFGSPCNWPSRFHSICPTLPSRCCPTSLAAPCLSKHQPTCTDQHSCFQTCGVACTALPLCNIRTETCPPRTIGATCPNSLPVAGCTFPTPPLTQGCTIWGDCTALTICIQIAPPTNPGATYPGYVGGFNPYQTSY